MKNIIKKLRKENGLRQEDLAKELGVSRQAVNVQRNRRRKDAEAEAWSWVLSQRVR